MVEDTIEEDTVVVENVIEETTVVTKKRSQRQLLAIPDYDAVKNTENSFENFAVDTKKEVKKEDQENAASAFETSTTMAVANVKRKILGEVDNNVDVKRKLSSEKTLLTGQRNLILASVI